MPNGFEKFGGFLVVEFKEFGFGFGVKEHAVGWGDEGAEFVFARGVGKHPFIGVEYIEEGFGGEQQENTERRQINVAVTRSGKEGASVFEDGLCLFGGCDFACFFFVALGFFF